MFSSRPFAIDETISSNQNFLFFWRFFAIVIFL
jgi:hypothetical protein